MKNSGNTAPINYPCFFGCENGLLRIASEGEAKTWIKRHLYGNRYLLRYGASPKLKISFIIDRNGAFRTVEHLKKKCEWARPLAFIYDFVLSECEVLPGEKLTSSQLIDRLKYYYPVVDPHFPNAKYLLSYLKKMPSDEKFEEEEVRKFYNKHWV